MDLFARSGRCRIASLSTLAKDFEFSDPEVARIKAAIQMWDSYGASADRRWLQPLVEELFTV